MVTVRNDIFLRYDGKNGKSIHLMELECDSVADLPPMEFSDSVKLSQGTLAHDISTGAFYALDSTGTWYAQDGSGAVEVNGNAESV
ncbi:MAG: hypothetical protein IJ779_08320 [Ruminococcus sp.]|nr:hypothetical protein [Ruminococcus sp.]